MAGWSGLVGWPDGHTVGWSDGLANKLIKKHTYLKVCLETNLNKFPKTCSIRVGGPDWLDGRMAGWPGLVGWPDGHTVGWSDDKIPTSRQLRIKTVETPPTKDIDHTRNKPTYERRHWDDAGTCERRVRTNGGRKLQNDATRTH